MATRMQQRRGTAAQWTSADPVLAAGEIGFEIDTNQFKMGDGVNAWSDLSYFKNLEDLGGSLDDYVLVSSKGQANGVAELDNSGKIPSSQIPELVGLDTEIATAVQNAVNDLVNGAPAALDTLNEIAAAVNDDENFAAWVAQSMSAKAPLASPNLQGVPTAPTAAISVNNTQIATTGYVKAQGYLTSSDLSDINSGIQTLENDVAGLQLDVASHTTDLGTLSSTVSTHTGEISGLTSAQSTLTTASNSHATDIQSLQSDVSGLTTTVSGQGGDIGNLQSDMTSAQSSITTLQGDVTTAEGNISTLQGDLDTAEATLATAVSDLSGHTSATTSVHGIADTSALATKSYADSAASTAEGNASTALSTHTSATTSVHGIADTSKLVTTDAQTQTLDGALIISGNLTVNGTTTTVSTANFATEDAMIYLGEGNTGNSVDLGFVSSFNDGTYQHSGLVRDASDSKWKLFKGVTDEPTTTVNFSQGSLDDLAVAGLTASSATIGGVAFTAKADKTAPISSKTSGYTIADGDQNSIIEYNSSSAGTITIPADNAFWPVGQRLELLQVAGGQITVAGGAGVMVYGTPGLKTRAQWSGATIIKRSENNFVVVGDLSA